MRPACLIFNILLRMQGKTIVLTGATSGIGLIATPGARIVSTASDAHRGAQLDFNNLQMVSGYSGFKTYSRSKLCNILFTRELAKQLKPTGVIANSLHPGFVNTRFGDSNRGAIASAFKLAKKFRLTP